ncbi:MAG: nucleoside/nucleotide kinase family protein [Actinomycetales bacterium]
MTSRLVMGDAYRHGRVARWQDQNGQMHLDLGSPSAWTQVIDRARALAADGQRRLLGIAGPPGGGKSTLAEALVRHLGPQAALVPMDGFHLDDGVLARLGLAEVKGAPTTFDVGGLVALLHRLRHGGEDGDEDGDEEVVYAPVFDRTRELSLAGALAVPRGVPLVVVEGNYLLTNDGAWASVRGLLHEAWYVHVDDEVRVPRLVARHVAHGRTPDAARTWVERSDEANAQLVKQTAARADVVLDATRWAAPFPQA